VSGSDDNLILVWDRRALNESQPKPVGTFAGHTNGITFVHSRVIILRKFFCFNQFYF
jgi:WD repeat-containing protein 23